MIGWIVSFLSGTIGRLLLGGGAILAAWLFVKTHYESKGAMKERERSMEAGRENARKAKAARQRVDKIPDASLRDRYFRD